MEDLVAKPDAGLEALMRLCEDNGIQRHEFAMGGYHVISYMEIPRELVLTAEEIEAIKSKGKEVFGWNYDLDIVLDNDRFVGLKVSDGVDRTAYQNIVLVGENVSLHSFDKRHLRSQVNADPEYIRNFLANTDPLRLFKLINSWYAANEWRPSQIPSVTCTHLVYGEKDSSGFHVKNGETEYQLYTGEMMTWEEDRSTCDVPNYPIQIAGFSVNLAHQKDKLVLTMTDQTHQREYSTPIALSPINVRDIRNNAGSYIYWMDLDQNGLMSYSIRELQSVE